MKSKDQELKRIGEEAQADYLFSHRLFSWRYPYAYVFVNDQDSKLKTSVKRGIKLWNENTLFHFIWLPALDKEDGLVKVKNDPTLLKKIGAVGLTKHPHHDNAWQNDQVTISVDLDFLKRKELLNNVIAHELGHALGLPDVHFKSIEYGLDNEINWLQPCDILAVKKIYRNKKK